MQTIQSHVNIIQWVSNACTRKIVVIIFDRAKLLHSPFPTDCFTMKTTVGKEYKEPKWQKWSVAMLKLEYDKKETRGR